MATTSSLHLMCKVFNILCFYTGQAYRHYQTVPVGTAFNDPDPGKGLAGEERKGCSPVHFVKQYIAVRVKSDLVFKHVSQNTIPLGSENFIVVGTCLYGTDCGQNIDGLAVIGQFQKRFLSNWIC